MYFCPNSNITYTINSIVNITSYNVGTPSYEGPRAQLGRYNELLDVVTKY